MADRIVCSCVTCPGCGIWVVVEREIARASGTNNKDKVRTRCPLSVCAKEFAFETNETRVFELPTSLFGCAEFSSRLSEAAQTLDPISGSQLLARGRGLRERWSLGAI
jgi:hypothetical protein